jgi:hypothetical protein
VPSASTTAIITNGLIELGVNQQGNMNVPGGSVASNEPTTLVGLRYIPTNADAASPGTPAEGWGVSVVFSQENVTGYANVGIDGVVNLSVVSFTHTADSAVATVDVGTTLEVTHDFHPIQSTLNLYEVTITITNLTNQTIQDLRYRRVVDWDITGFDEYVTNNLGTTSPLVIGDRPAVLGDTNDGFESANPLSPRSGRVFPMASGNFDTFGPSDQGTLFDLGFGSLAGHTSRTFHLYYGAAGTQADALTALESVGAEVYSLAKPTVLPDGPKLGKPNTFILGFTGVGGAPAVTQTQRIVVPPGGQGTAQALSSSGVVATLTGGNGVVLIVATLDVPPVGLPAPLESLTDIQTIGDTKGASLDAKFYYPTTVTPKDAQRLEVIAFDAKHLQFVDVVGVGPGGKPMKPQLVAGHVTVSGNEFGGYFQVTLDSTTMPALPLEGTIFAITLPNVVTTTSVVNPPTASAASGPSGSALTFTSTTQLSLGLTAAPTSRASAGGVSPGLGGTDTGTVAQAVSSAAAPTASGSAISSSTSSAGAGTDGTPPATPLSNDELYLMWLIMEQMGGFPINLPPLPVDKPAPPKPRADPPPAPEQEARSDASEMLVLEKVPAGLQSIQGLAKTFPEARVAAATDQEALALKPSAALVTFFCAVPWRAWSWRKERKEETPRQRRKARRKSLGLLELPCQ